MPLDKKKETIILTYGTFDLLHVGHLNLLERLSALGTRLIVGVSTDEFNAIKGKRTVIPFEDRARLVGALKCVDTVIPEDSWEQKRSDIQKYNVNIFGMGSDWAGKFDSLNDSCDVVYLDRTADISSTALKSALQVLSQQHISDLKKALDLIAAIIARFD